MLTLGMAARRELWGLLRSCDAFAALPDESISRISDLAETESFAAGAPIAKEGERSRFVYIVRDGQARGRCGRENGLRIVARRSTKQVARSSTGRLAWPACGGTAGGRVARVVT